MCVHVYCAERMPNSTLVWVDRRPGHLCVFADGSLATATGELTRAGVRVVNDALAAVPGAPSLESAKPCGGHPL